MVDKDVVRFEIAMDDARRVGMGDRVQYGGAGLQSPSRERGDPPALRWSPRFLPGTYSKTR